MSLVYLLVGGVILYWLFMAGGINQVQGWIGGIGSSLGIGGGGGSGGVSSNIGGGDSTPNVSADVLGIHAGTDGVRVPGLLNIDLSGIYGQGNVQKTISNVRNVGGNTYSHTNTSSGGGGNVNQTNTNTQHRVINGQAMMGKISYG